jgi:type II secretory pathway pseudopilin PulG
MTIEERYCDRVSYMHRPLHKAWSRPGVTLVELIVATAIMTLVATAMVPLFTGIRNSWTSRQAAVDVLENGRALMEHLSRNLSQAMCITQVSDASQTSGYIEYENNDGNDFRYQMGSNSYVQFGLVGNLSDLAGPASQLTFTCYGASDLDTPITDVTSIRLIKIIATLTSSSSLSRNQTFTASVYLRTNGQNGSGSGWWKLDETSGTTAADSSGNGNNGTLTNMAGSEWTTGQIDGALAFNGTSNYVSIPTLDSKFSNTSTFTAAGWFKTTQSTGLQTIVGQWGTPASHVVFGWEVLVVNNKVAARFGLANFTSPQITGTSTVNDGNWHDFALVYRAYPSSSVLYVDGSSQGTGAMNFYSAPPYMKFRIGDGSYNAHGGAEGGGPFQGTIDDVRIYNRALTAAEVAQLAIRYKDFTETKAGSDTTSLAIPTPSATAVGDLLIAAIATDGDTSASIAAPSGWTLINRGAYSSAVTLGVWWMNASSAGTISHTFTWTGSQQAYGWMMRFTGHDPTNPINASSSSGATSATPTSPAVTTTVQNCLILRLGAFDDDEITVDSPGLAGHIAITMDKSSADPTGLVGWWKLNETSGTTTADSSGNGNNGTLVNMNPATDWVTGQIGGALDCDGTNDYVNCGNGASLNITAQVTLAVWVKTRDCGNSAFNPYVDKGDHSYALRHNSSNNLSFAIHTNSTWYAADYAVTSAFNNSWHHVAGSYDGSNVKLYVDGVLRGTTNHVGSIDSTTYGVNIGRCSEQTSRLYNGVIDDVRIYNRALSATEIAQLASGAVSGGAGYVRQSAIGSSGTSTFSLGSSNEARMLTIAIAPIPGAVGSTVSP